MLVLRKCIGVFFMIMSILSAGLLTGCVGDSSSSSVSSTDTSQNRLDNLDERQQYTIVNINSMLSAVITDPQLVDNGIGESNIHVKFYLTGLDNTNYKLNIGNFEPADRRGPMPIVAEHENEWVMPTAYLVGNHCILNATDQSSECTIGVALNNAEVKEYDATLELIDQHDGNLLKATLRLYVSDNNGVGYFLVDDKYIRLQLLNG